MDSQTLALISDLQPNWQESFHSASPLSISLLSTDSWNPSRQLGTDRTTAETVGLMANHAVRAAHHPRIQSVIRSLAIENLKDIQEVLQAIFKFIKGRVRFVEDNEPLGRMFGIADSKELLITPPALLSMKSPKGDCDDFSMLAASLMIASGIPCSFVTVAADERAPDTFTHVYVEAVGIPFDVSHGREVGWETEKRFRREVWPIFAGNGEGVGMIVGREGYEKAWLGAGLRGLLGLGDDSTPVDYSSGMDLPVINTADWSIPVINQIPNTNTTVFSGATAPPVNWNNLLPGIFSSAEKIAQQTTQQPGYQIVGPNGQMTSYVLPQGGAMPTSIPGLSTASLGSMLPLLLIGGVALLIFNKG